MRFLLGTVILVVDFPLSVLKIYPAIPFWPAEFLLKDQLLSMWNFPYVLLVASPLLLLIFFFLFGLCQFDQCVCWRVSPWIYPVWDSLCLLDLIGYFLFHVGEIFNYNCFKNFPIPFLSLFLFWDPYNENVGAFDIVPQV